MSIHGYNSNGDWQNKVTNCLTDLKLKSFPYSYGRKIFRVLPHQIKNDVDAFRDWYFEVVEDPKNGIRISEPFHRPSIMAHSLGTWILAKALTKYPEIKFDKIFLFGSVIPFNFDWFKLIIGAQINAVIYEKAKKDKIAPLGLIFTGSIKPSGTKGFAQKSTFIKEEVNQLFGHSDFNYNAHIKNVLNKHLYNEPHQLAVIHGKDLGQWQIGKYFKDSSKIDLIIYPEEYHSSPLTLENAINFFKIEKDIWSFIKNTRNNSIIGYINAIPVDDEVYKKFCSGEIIESNLKASNILDYDNCESYNLLVLSIVIKKSQLKEDTTLNKGRIAEMLIMSFIYKIKLYNNKCRKLKRIGAFAWTDEGIKLSNGFCMTKKEGKSNKPFYEIDFTKQLNININGANFMFRWWYKTNNMKFKS